MSARHQQREHGRDVVNLPVTVHTTRRDVRTEPTNRFPSVDRAHSASLVAALVIMLVAARAAGAGPIERPVVGGQASTLADHPAVVAIVYRDGGPLCTGTLIARDVVLTAAHCLDPALHGDAIPSVTRALDLQQDVTWVAGHSKHVPASYDSASDPPDALSRNSDIGILILDDELAVEPVRVLRPDEAGLLVGASVDIVGYGVFQLDPRRAAVKHHATATLQAVDEAEILVSAPGEPQNCGGDSGGPAIAWLDGAPRIIGVVSRSADRTGDCVAGTIDTRADAFADWTADVVAEERQVSSGCATTGTESNAPSLLVLFAWLIRRRGRDELKRTKKTVKGYER
ncbi:MAG: trypsin-like serine protease [Kofleriaceae bacterium]